VFSVNASLSRSFLVRHPPTNREHPISDSAFMKISSTSPWARFLAHGSWIVVKSALNSVIATLVLALALIASLAQ
jgi:hypothetical protein